MASSNRHWPSMFKSKPHPHQWQHDINSTHRSSPFSSGCEERSPEPKPRWNPKPEQIRILEAIFNSGMVNPPREEIRRIRAQLQEYGQVGDANVFYWFQNRKSRNKHKLRLHSKHSLPQSQSQSQSQSPSSSSSPSPKSTKPRKNKISNNNNNNNNNNSNTNLSLMGMSPSESAFLFPVSSIVSGGGYEGMSSSSQLGFLSSEMMSNVEEQQKAAATSGLLLSEIMNNNTSVSYTSNPHPPPHHHHQHHHHLISKEDEEMRLKMMMLQPQICCYNNILLHTPMTTSSTTSATTSDSVVVTVPSNSDHLHFQGGVRKRIFINEMEVEITSGPFNVREAFGEEAVLIDSEGQPLLTDQYGIALNPLQHGASYYLI